MAKRSPSTHTLARKAGIEVLELPRLRIRLEVKRGAPSELELGLDTVCLGSGPDCDLVVSERGVSRRHCLVRRAEEGVVLEDLGSKNGTYVNGVRVQRAFLTTDVRVEVGEAVVRLIADGPAASVPLFPGNEFGGAVGASLVMRALFAKLERCARTEQPLLLCGESGTGKEVLARAVHDQSPRRQGPFVVVDCASVQANLIEAELFGHAAGAFTGAERARVGLLEQASGGTVFLDELGELPLELQPKLLRALETKQVRPLGTDEWRPADVRVVAASHRDIHGMLRAKTFREDLFFRIAVVELSVPPLRERPGDIPLLVERFLAKQVPPRHLDDLPAPLLDLLSSHHWPGNVRELKNVLARLQLFPELGARALEEPVSGTAASPGPTLPLREARELVVSEWEARFIRQRIAACRGNVSHAAESLGVSRQFLHRLMARYAVGSDES